MADSRVIARIARRDPQQFLIRLGGLVNLQKPDLATTGAGRLVWEVFGSDALRIPAALPLIDAAIDYKQAHGAASTELTGYEWERVLRRRGSEQ